MEFSLAAMSLPKYPSCLPINSYSQFKTQLLTTIFAKHPLRPPLTREATCSFLCNPVALQPDIYCITSMTPSPHRLCTLPSTSLLSLEGLMPGRHTKIWSTPWMTHKIQNTHHALSWENIYTHTIEDTSSLFNKQASSLFPEHISILQ